MTKPTGRPRGRPRKYPLAPTPALALENPVQSNVVPNKTGLETGKQEIEENKDYRGIIENALISAGSNLKKLFCSLLPRASTRTREKLQKATEMTLQGLHWLDISGIVGLSHHELNAYKRNYPDFMRLFNEARAAGEEIRQIQREKVAHDRAVDGWKEPVFYKGGECGVIKRFDNRLLEFLLKADNPEKYRDRGESAGGPGSSHNIMVQWNFGDRPSKPVINVPETITPTNDSKG